MAQKVKIVFTAIENVSAVLASMTKSTSLAVKNFEKANSKLIASTKKGLTKSFKLALIGATAFGAALVKVAIDGAKFQAAISEVGAVSGATASQLKKLEKAALKAGATTAFTATESAKALVQLARSGLSTSQSIRALQSTLDLAAASGGSMAQSSNLISSSLKQFSLTAGESGRVADVFATAMAKSRFDIDSLSQAMKFAGTVGSALGMSLEETTAAVAQFVNLGLEGSMAGTNFRMAMTALTKETSKGEKALKKLGLTYAEINPEVFSFAEIVATMGKEFISVTDAVSVFGTRAGANMANIINKQAALKQAAKELGLEYDTLSGSIVGLTKELIDSNGKAGTMASKMLDNVSGQFRILMSVIEDVKLGIFATFGDSLQTVLGNLQGTFTKNKQAIIGVFVKVLKFGRDFASLLLDMTATAIDLFAEMSFGLNTTFDFFATTIPGAFKAFISIMVAGVKSLFKKIFDLASKLVNSKFMQKILPKGVIDGFNAFGKALEKNTKGSFEKARKKVEALKKEMQGNKAVAYANLNAQKALAKGFNLASDQLDKLNFNTIQGTEASRESAEAKAALIKLNKDQEALQIRTAELLAKRVKAEKELAKRSLKDAKLAERALKSAKEGAKIFAKYLAEKIRLQGIDLNLQKGLLEAEAKRFDLAKKQIKLAGESAKQAVGSLMGGDLFSAGGATATLGSFATNAFSAIESSIEAGLSTVIAGLGFGSGFDFAELGSALGDAVGDGLDSLLGNSGPLREGIGMLGSVVSAGFSMIFGIIANLPEIINFLEKVPQLVNKALPQIIESLPSIVTTGLKLLPKLLTELLPELVRVLLTDVLPALIKAIPTLLTALIDGVATAIEIIFDQLPEILMAVIDALIIVILKLPEMIAKLLGAILKGLNDAITEMGAEVGNSVGNAVSDIAKSTGVSKGTAAIGIGTTLGLFLGGPGGAILGAAIASQITGGGNKRENANRRKKEAANMFEIGIEAGREMFSGMRSVLINATDDPAIQSAVASLTALRGATLELASNLGNKDIKEIIEVLNAMVPAIEENIVILKDYITTLEGNVTTLEDGLKSVGLKVIESAFTDLDGGMTSLQKASLDLAFAMDDLDKAIGPEGITASAETAASAVINVFNAQVDEIKKGMDSDIKVIKDHEAERVKLVNEHLEKRLKAIEGWQEDSLSTVQLWTDAIGSALASATELFEQLAEFTDTALLDLQSKTTNAVLDAQSKIIEEASKADTNALKESTDSAIKILEDQISALTDSDASKNTENGLEEQIKLLREALENDTQAIDEATKAKLDALEEQRQVLQNRDLDNFLISWTQLQEKTSGDLKEAVDLSVLNDAQDELIKFLENGTIDIEFFKGMTGDLSTMFDANKQYIAEALDAQKAATLSLFDKSGLGQAGFKFGDFEETNKASVDTLSALFREQVNGNNFAEAQMTLAQLLSEKQNALAVEASNRVDKANDRNKILLGFIKTSTETMVTRITDQANSDLEVARKARDNSILYIQTAILTELRIQNGTLDTANDLLSDSIAGLALAGLSEAGIKAGFDWAKGFNNTPNLPTGTGRFIENDQIARIHKGERVLNQAQQDQLFSRAELSARADMRASTIPAQTVSPQRETSFPPLEIRIDLDETALQAAIARGIKLNIDADNIVIENGDISVKDSR